VAAVYRESARLALQLTSMRIARRKWQLNAARLCSPKAAAAVSFTRDRRVYLARSCMAQEGHIVWH
jgi:hypothetical protein